MKKPILTITLLFFLIAASHTVQAQQNKLGVGAIIGAPDGLSIKGWVAEDIAIDGALSFTIGNNTSSLYLHSNILFHKNLREEGFDVESGSLDFYYGAGIQLQWLDVADDIYTALRAPAGFSYGFERAPGELFFELVPTLDVNPSVQFRFSGAVGARYFLRN